MCLTGCRSPFDLWPNGLGFEYFYGFTGGDNDQWHPALYENTRPIEPYLGNPNYILDNNLADKAIAWMEMQHAQATPSAGSDGQHGGSMSVFEPELRRFTTQPLACHCAMCVRTLRVYWGNPGR
jgi:hypothetical protein